MSSNRPTDIPLKMINSDPICYIRNVADEDWNLIRTETPPEEQIGSSMIIEGMLKHNSGSLIQIVPVDTANNQPKIKEYDSHKVRLSDRCNNSKGFLVWNGEMNSNGHISVSTHPQSKYTPDVPPQKLAENLTITAESQNTTDTVFESIVNVVLLVSLAAKYISSQQSTQSKLQKY